MDHILEGDENSFQQSTHASPLSSGLKSGKKSIAQKLKQDEPIFLTYSQMQTLIEDQQIVVADEETESFRILTKSFGSNGHLSQSNKQIDSADDRSLYVTTSQLLFEKNDSISRQSSEDDMTYSMSHIMDKRLQLNENMPFIEEVTGEENISIVQSDENDSAMDKLDINYNLDQYLNKLEQRIKNFTDVETPINVHNFNLGEMSIQQSQVVSNCYTPSILESSLPKSMVTSNNSKGKRQLSSSGQIKVNSPEQYIIELLEIIRDKNCQIKILKKQNQIKNSIFDPEIQDEKKIMIMSDQRQVQNNKLLQINSQLRIENNQLTLQQTHYKEKIQEQYIKEEFHNNKELQLKEMQEKVNKYLNNNHQNLIKKDNLIQKLNQKISAQKKDISIHITKQQQQADMMQVMRLKYTSLQMDNKGLTNQVGNKIRRLKLLDMQNKIEKDQNIKISLQVKELKTLEIVLKEQLIDLQFQVNGLERVTESSPDILRQQFSKTQQLNFPVKQNSQKSLKLTQNLSNGLQSERYPKVALQQILTKLSNENNKLQRATTNLGKIQKELEEHQDMSTPKTQKIHSYQDPILNNYYGSKLNSSHNDSALSQKSFNQSWMTKEQKIKKTKMIIPNNFDRIQQLSTEKKPQSNYLAYQQSQERSQMQQRNIMNDGRNQTPFKYPGQPIQYNIVQFPIYNVSEDQHQQMHLF